MAKTTKTTGKTGSNVTALDTGKPAARKMAGGGRNAISIIAITLISRQPMLQNALSEVALDGLPGGSGKLTKPNLKEMTYEERGELARYHRPGDGWRPGGQPAEVRKGGGRGGEQDQPRRRREARGGSPAFRRGGPAVGHRRSPQEGLLRPVPHRQVGGGRGEVP